MLDSRILFLQTNIGKIESTLTVEEAQKEIEDAKKEGRLAKIEAPVTTSQVNDGEGEIFDVKNKAVKYLNLEEVKIFSYDDNYLTPIEKDEDTEEVESE